jgi:hypothetical protein
MIRHLLVDLINLVTLHELSIFFFLMSPDFRSRIIMNHLMSELSISNRVSPMLTSTLYWG